MKPNSNNAFPSQYDNLMLDSSSQRLIDLTSDPPSQRIPEAIEEILSILQKKTPKLLDGLAESNKIQLAKHCQLKTYLRDEIVFLQGDEPDAFYTVIRGTVSVYAREKNSIQDLVAFEDISRERYGVFLLQLPPGEVRRIYDYCFDIQSSLHAYIHIFHSYSTVLWRTFIQ